MLTIHDYFSHFTHLTLAPASLVSRMLCKLYLFYLLHTSAAQCKTYNTHTKILKNTKLSSWMSDTLLTLNTSKTKFLLIGSNSNSNKLPLAHLTQYTLLVIVASFLMNILLFLTRYLIFLNPATHIFVSFDASLCILI